MENVMNLKQAAALAIVAAATAGALAAAAPVSAYAAEPSAAGTYVTAAATRAAGPSVDILGADGVEESGQFVNTSSYYDWNMPKYYLFASTYNENPSTYLYNLANGATPAAVLNASGRSGTGGGPNAALGTSANDTAIAALADVVVGNGGDASKGLPYSFANNASLVTTMDTIAAALDSASTTTGKALRYGSASAIAQQYEEYMYGTTGYIQKALNEETAERRTVALVSGVTLNSDGSNTYTLLETSSSGAGTASTNRYLEAAMGVSLGMDIADNYGDLETSVSATDLTDSVDLVMVGGQQGASSYDDIEAALVADGLISKAYFVEDNGTQGAAYGVIMNSVENAQNIGRVLGCLYPELVDQDDFVAYYYDNFYHIEKSDLGTVMDGALDGVRNWDAAGTTVADLVKWDASDASTYNEAAVQSIITEGYQYYQSL